MNSRQVIEVGSAINENQIGIVADHILKPNHSLAISVHEIPFLLWHPSVTRVLLIDFD
jgi:hypothetical protein